MQVSSVNNIVSKQSFLNRSGKKDNSVILDLLENSQNNSNAIQDVSENSSLTRILMASVVFLVPFLCLFPIEAKSFHSANKSKMFAKAGIMTLLSSIGFWILNKANSKNDEMAVRSGYYKFLSENADNKNAFVSLGDDEKEEIHEDERHESIMKRKYAVSQIYYPYLHTSWEHITNIHKDFAKYKSVVREKYSTAEANSDADDMYKILEKYDSEASKYEQKVVQGMNIGLTALTALSTAGVAVVPKLFKKDTKHLTGAMYLSMAFLSLPMFISGKLSSLPVLKNIYQASRLKAMENLRNETEGKPALHKEEESSFECTVDYYKNRKKYKKDMARQKDLTDLKNLYKNELELTKEEEQQAEQTGVNFASAVKQYFASGLIRKNSVARTYLNNYISNCTLFPTFVLLFRGLLAEEGTVAKNNKNFLYAGGIMTAGYLLNAILAKIMYRNSKN